MRILTCLAIVFLIFSTSQAEIELTNIAVSKYNDSVSVEITASKPCLYEHFMMKKAPERIVVDLKGTLNAWSRKNFENLPFKSIEKIRTSQFRISPELITRIVLDINRPIDYTVEQLPMGLKITIPAADGEQSFLPWKAQHQRQPSAAKMKNETKNPPKAKKTVPQKKKYSVKIESFPKRKVVAYRAGSTRDPFRPLIGNSGTNVSSGDIPAIENLSLVGIFDDDTGRKALFEDTEGKGFILSPNDRVQNGYLVSVREDKAIFQVTEYGWTRTVALNLQLPGLK